MVFTFYVLDLKNKSGQKRKKYEYEEFSDDIHFFNFWPEIPFWTNLVQKIKIVSLKKKKKYRTILILICRFMQNICGVHYFCFRPEKTCLGKSGQKNQNFQLKQKFVTKTNLNMQSSMMMFTFSVFDQKYLFGPIWSKKSKLSVWAQISH